MPQGTQIDKKMIERGYWIAMHRLTIQKWTTIILGIVVALIFAIFFLQFGMYLYQLKQWDSLIVKSKASLYDWAHVHEVSRPRDIEFSSPKFLLGSENTYDLFVEIYNPNTHWAVEALSYEFLVNNATRVTAEQPSFILPGETKLLIAFRYQSSVPITQVSVNVTNFRWRKLHNAPEISWFLTEPPKFTGRQINVSGNTQSIVPARVSWTVKNQSTINFRNVVWQVGMYSGASLVAVLEYGGGPFKFFEERTFDLPVFGQLPRIDSVKVFPIIDIFDPEFFYLD